MRKIGPYVVVQNLTRGKQADVALAVLPGYPKALVVKTFAPAEDLADKAETLRQRFDREIALSQRLAHPYLVETVGAAPDADPPYLVTAFVAGVPLSRLLDDPRAYAVPPSVALRIVVDVLEVLDYLHTAVDAQHDHVMLAHRDVAPQNLILGFDGHTRLIDLGLAKANSWTRLTANNTALGTLRYMSPEVASGSAGQVRGATDVYGLGVIAFELLAAQPMRPRLANVADMVTIAQSGSVPNIRLPREVPPAVWTAVFTSLHVHPQRRYASAAQMRSAIEVAGASIATADEAATWVRETFAADYADQVGWIQNARLLSRSLPMSASPLDSAHTHVVARAIGGAEAETADPPRGATPLHEATAVVPRDLVEGEELAAGSAVLMRAMEERFTDLTKPDVPGLVELPAPVSAARPAVREGATSPRPLAGPVSLVVWTILIVALTAGVTWRLARRDAPALPEPREATLPVSSPALRDGASAPAAAPLAPTVVVAEPPASSVPRPSHSAAPLPSRSPTSAGSPRERVSTSGEQRERAAAPASGVAGLRARLAAGEPLQPLLDAARALAESEGASPATRGLLKRAESQGDRKLLEAALDRMQAE